MASQGTCQPCHVPYFSPRNLIYFHPSFPPRPIVLLPPLARCLPTAFSIKVDTQRIRLLRSLPYVHFLVFLFINSAIFSFPLLPFSSLCLPFLPPSPQDGSVSQATSQPLHMFNLIFLPPSLPPPPSLLLYEPSPSLSPARRNLSTRPPRPPPSARRRKGGSQ